MPPRWLTLAIIAFWLATMGWLFYRDILPRFRAEPPPHVIDLVDEVTSQQITWEVLQEERQVGKATSEVQRAGQNFELRCRLTFTNFRLLKAIESMSSMQRVTGDGELLGLEATVKGQLAENSEFDGKVSGTVENGFLLARVAVKALGISHKLDLEKVKVPRKLLDPLLVVNKVVGLHEGKRWAIPLVDAVSLVMPGNTLRALPHVDAEVTSKVPPWNKDVECFLIEYRDADQRVTGRTWVRQRDGLVLQQEAMYEGMELVLRRAVK